MNLGLTPLGAWNPVQRHNFAVDTLCFFSRDLKRKDGTVYFETSSFDWLSRLKCNRVGKLVASRSDPGTDFFEDFSALPYRQFARDLKSLDRCGNRLFDFFWSCPVNNANGRFVIGAANFHCVARLAPLSCNETAIFSHLRSP